MGCYDVFCALCGGPLSPISIWDSHRSNDPQPGGMYWDYNQELLKDEDLEWLRDVRIVSEWQSKTDQDKHTKAAATVYYASEFDACEGPFDATDTQGITHWCYAFAKGENESNYPGDSFVVHSACLLIAKRWMFEEGKTIQDLYTSLSVYDEELFRGVLLPNKHYGAGYFWEQDWLAKQGWEFIVRDPVNIPGMTEYVLSKLQPTSAAEGESSTEDDQAFYRKQLLSGHILAMQDLDLGLIEERWDEIKDRDWRRLVRTLSRYENFYAGEGGSGPLGELHDAPIGLKNRMRLVKIMQGIFAGT